ncbi:hypothetical protein FNF28_03058 [Cafeteria roenbergensis]|uniref:Uncharacterized protein n=1 Tax=Cafeteria roenbergensis TaxID=33653 RepID=A0A5A8DPN4_CAFRO|nr:hypothetical protein FNF28_03058 [Cafeteria roenbergensis]
MRHVLVLALALAALAPEAVSRPEGSSGRAGVHPGSRSGAAASAGAPQAPRLGPAPIDDAHTEAHLKPSRYAKLPPHNLAIPGVHPHAESSGTGPGAPPAAKGAREKAAPKAKPATLVFSTPDSLYAEATRGAAAEAVARAADAAAVAARKSGKDADSGSGQTESSLDVLRREGLGGASGSSRGGSAPVDEGVVPGSPFASEAGADVEAFPLLDHLLSAADSGRLSETAATRALRGEADARSAGRRGELADLDAAAAVGIQQPTSLSALVKAVAADDTLAEGRAAAAPHGGLPSDPATGSVTSASDVTSPATALASVRDAMGLGNLVVTEAPVDDDLVLSLAARAAVADAVAADLLAPQAASHVAPVAAVVAGDAAAARPAPLRLGLVALLDLAPLANDRLPHEVEAFVGSLLGLARFVVLPKALPERRFFSFWSGAAALVEAAADKVGLVVTVRELGQPKSGSASSSASRWQSSSSSSSSSYPWGRNMGADNGREPPGDEMPEPPKPSPELVLVAVQTPEEAWAERAAFAAAKKRLGSAAASSGSAAQATPGSASPGSAGTASRPLYGSAAPPSPSSAGAGTASSGTAASAGSEAASSGAKAVERLRELGSFPARVALAAGHGADPAAAEAAVLSPASLGGTCVAPLVRFTQSMVEAAVDDAIAGLEARAAALATPPSSPAQASLDPRKTASTASLWGTSGEQERDPFGRPQTPIAVEAPHKRALKRLKTVKPHFVAAVTAALGAAGLSSAGPDSAAALAAGLWGQPLDPLPLGFPLDVLLAMGLGSSDKEGLFHQMVASGRVPAYSRPDRLQVTAYGVEGCGHHGSPSHPADSLPSLDAAMGDEAKEEEEEEEEEEEDAELQPALSPEVGPGAAVLVAGDELSLLAAKIARAMPRAAVVALAQRPSSVDPTSRLASLLKLRNLLLARGRLTPARVNALAAVPDPFRLQVLGTGWTSLLLHAADAPEAAEAALGRVLRLASSTLLQLPAWPELASGLLSVRGGAASADMWAGSRGTAGTLAACVAAARARGADAALHGPLSASAACAWEVLSGVGGGDASQPEAGGMGQSADVPLEDILGAASAPGAAGVAAPSRVAAEERASARAESSFAQPGSGGSATTAADRLNTFRYGSAALSEHAALKARYDPSGDSSPVAADDPAAASAGRLGSVFASRVASADTPLARFRPLARLLARAARLAGLPHASFRFVTESAPARAAATAGARREADASQLFATGRVFLRVDVAPWARRDAPAAAPRAPPAFPLAVPVPATASTSSSSWPAAGPLLSASPGVSLHTLLVLGLVPAHRAEVFRMHLRLPLPLVAAASASMGWSPRPASAAAAPAGSPPAKAAGPASPAALAPWAVRFMPPATAAALQAVEPSAAAWMRLGADPLAAGPDAPGASSGAGAMSAAARAALEDAVRSSGAGRLAVLVVAPEAVSARAQAVAGGGSSKLGYLPARRLWVWSGNPAEEAATPEGGAEGALAWAAISSQLPRLDTASGGSAGKFSAIDLESGAGALSLRLAQAYPEATVVSVEQSATLTDLHLAAAMRRGLGNAVLCRKQVDPALVHSLYKSPEFLRFLTLGPDVLDLVRRHGLSGAGDLLGYAMGSAATSFLRTPEAASLSLAFTSLFHSYPDPDWIAPPAAWGTPHGRQSSRHASAGARAGSPYAAAGAGAGVGEHAAMAPLGGESAVVDPGFAGRFSLAFHPRPLFRRAEARILSSLAKPPGGKLHVAATPVMAALPVAPDWPAMGSGVIRVDVVNMSRHVNHHFQSEKDGHDRTYTLIVQGNATAHEALDQLAPAQRSDPRAVYRLLDKGNHPNGGGVVSVRLTRDKDKAAIPYVTVHGVTLITVLRLGLLAPLRARAYGQFVHLPLYQDMAPWNIVFLGADLDYIDFDTRDHTYDAVVPRAYEVMEVLFNYKRTVEDFKMCGGKAGNPYNFPYVSECVQSPDFSGPCKDSKVPVPCGDGRCHSDYVSCLRSMAEEADRKRGPGHWAGVGLEATDKAFRRQGLRGSAGAGETSEASLFEALQASLPPSIGAARAPEAHQTASAWLDSRAGRDARLAAHGRWEMRS